MKTFPLFAPEGAAPGGGAPLAAGGGGAAAPAGGAASGGGAGGGGGGAPAAWHTEFFKPDGTINRDVFGRMPEQYRGLGDGELKNIQTAEQFLAKVHGLTTLAGRKGLAPLPADAKAEDIAAQQAVIRSVLGVPEKPEGYNLTRPDDLPETAWDANLAKSAAELMHKHNVSPAAAKELIALQAASVKQQLAAQAQYEEQWFAEQDRTFRETLKKDGLDYDKTMGVIKQAAQQVGIPADSPLLKNATVLSALSNVAKIIGEDRLITGREGDANAGKSSRAVAEDIVHNKENPDNKAYWDPNHAKHAEVKKKVLGLWEAAAAEDAKAKR